MTEPKVNLSWRHHYVPKFYLKGFTNEDGFFHLFNKEKGEIEPNPKSPESYFFERDRNTFRLPHGELDDFIESSFYKQLDNVSKYAFEKLRNEGIQSINDNAQALSTILLFVNGIFYRIPKYDAFHNNEIANGSTKYFLPIYKGNHEDISREYYEEHKDEPLYRYACRFFLSLHGIIPVGTELDKWSVFELPAENPRLVFITGDCPIVLNDERLYNTGQEIVLVPLTKKHFAVRNNVPLRNDTNLTEVIYFTNLYLVANAQKYACGHDREILEFYIQRMNNFDRDAIKDKIISLLNGDF